jgi:hypothetical protein
MSGLGGPFAHAVARQDAAALAALFSDPVDFHALTPGATWRADTPHEVVDVMLGHWFGPHCERIMIRGLRHGLVGGRERVSYRLGIRRGGISYVLEQQAYFDADGRQISWMRLLCSGFRPDPAAD